MLLLLCVCMVETLNVYAQNVKESISEEPGEICLDYTYLDLPVGEQEELNICPINDDKYEKYFGEHSTFTWSSDSQDILIEPVNENKFGDVYIKAVKCSKKKKHHCNVYVECGDIVLKCDVMVYKNKKTMKYYKNKYKIEVTKGSTTLTVGDCAQLKVKGAKGKKIKWYAKESDEYYEPGWSCVPEITSDALIVNKNGKAVAVKFKNDSPTYAIVYAEIEHMRMSINFMIKTKKNKQELKTLKRILDRTNLSKKNKNKLIEKGHCSGCYCKWNGYGHLSGLGLQYVGLKGQVSFKEFKHLEALDLLGNYLKKIDLTKNKELYKIVVKDNELKQIDLRNNKKLEFFDASNNYLECIDFSQNTELIEVDISVNPIVKLDSFGMCSKLESLTVSNDTERNDCNCLEYLDASNNEKLQHLEAYCNPRLSEVSLPSGDALKYLCLELCGLKKIDLSNCIGLQQLFLYGNNVDKVTLSSKMNCELISCNEGVVFWVDGNYYSIDNLKQNILCTSQYWIYNFDYGDDSEC